MADQRVTCSICNTEKPIEDYWPSEVAKKRCRDCLRLSRQRRYNNSAEKYLLRAVQKLKHVRVKNGFDWTIDPDEIVNLWHTQGGKCAVSGLNMTHHRGAKDKKMPLNASIDRINSAEHYISGNVQLVCYQVNMMRHTLDVGEFEWWIRTIYEYQTRDS